MSYLNEPLTFAQKRELLKNEGMVLKRDIEYIEKEGVLDDIQLKQSEDESEIGELEIVWQDEFDSTNLRPHNIETLANFLKGKTENERKYGERQLEYDIKHAVSLLRNLGISSISND